MIFIFLPPNNLEFLEFRILYENTARNSRILNLKFQNLKSRIPKLEFLNLEFLN